ncbi:hypothetical protein EM595_p0223 (plasmid) [Duffyella gerundensis]|uniref:Uncharacterized protein n=1 Tax=Duffyella gerundensis TaxID=1619313 RepID=A0A0U5LB28_9GAMM|nr:hypothetical protein [Duffyella gerundensis]CUU25923.1 hypothetical protein EM595_p0223 [Duffyella gerundensis]
MRIKEKDGALIDVYAVYWINGKLYFYGLIKDYGLSAFDVDEVKVVDSSMSGEFIFFEDGVFFKPLIAEGLLDDLIEEDLESYRRFIEILKEKEKEKEKEKIDPDFY